MIFFCHNRKFQLKIEFDKNNFILRGALENLDANSPYWSFLHWKVRQCQRILSINLVEASIIR